MTHRSTAEELVSDIHHLLADATEAEAVGASTHHLLTLAHVESNLALTHAVLAVHEALLVPPPKPPLRRRWR